MEELVDSPMYEFGVTHVNLFYNKEDVCFCLLDAPDEEAVVKHHDKKHGKEHYYLFMKNS